MKDKQLEKIGNIKINKLIARDIFSDWGDDVPNYWDDDISASLIIEKLNDCMEIYKIECHDGIQWVSTYNMYGQTSKIIRHKKSRAICTALLTAQYEIDGENLKVR